MIMGSELQNEARCEQLQSQVCTCSSVYWRACNYVRVFDPLRVTAGRTSSHSNIHMSSRTQPQHPTTSFYTTVTKSPDHWQPGKYILTHYSPNPTVHFHTLLSEMQPSVSSELSKLQDTLSIITNCLEKLAL